MTSGSHEGAEASGPVPTDQALCQRGRWTAPATDESRDGLVRRIAIPSKLQLVIDGNTVELDDTHVLVVGDRERP